MNCTCKKCGMVIKNVTTKRIFCRCGTMTEVSLGSEDFRLTNRKIGKFNKNAFIKLPHWESSSRRAICNTCENFNSKSNRCSYIDLGCSCSYNQAVTSVQGKCPKDKWTTKQHKWITNADMAELVVKVSMDLPPDITRVVGIPRSGMMAAAYLATHLHLPLYSLIDGKCVSVGSGLRMNQYVEREGVTLVVDDTTANGWTWGRLQDCGFDKENTCFLSMYCSLECQHIPDFIGKILPLPHLLEWNLFSCGYISSAGLDMDGVICENNNGTIVPRPLYLPRNNLVKAIITARPDSYRADTLAWLDKWNVKYEELIMWPGSEHERTLDAVADYKATAFVISGCTFYIESDLGLANAMRDRGIRVFCLEDGLLK
jgi:hypothetical protein